MLHQTADGTSRASYRTSRWSAVGSSDEASGGYERVIVNKSDRVSGPVSPSERSQHKLATSAADAVGGGRVVHHIGCIG